MPCKTGINVTFKDKTTLFITTTTLESLKETSRQFCPEFNLIDENLRIAITKAKY